MRIKQTNKQKGVRKVQNLITHGNCAFQTRWQLICLICKHKSFILCWRKNKT